MLFRRIKAHIENENWFAVFIDFLIVVVGVFIGIQVSNWNAAQADKLLAQEYLQRLHEDLISDQQSASTRAEFNATVAANGAKALAFSESDAGDQLANWETVLAYFQASQVWHLSLSNATYVEMSNSGDLSLIKNQELRKALADYYVTSPVINASFIVKHVPEYRETIRSLIPSGVTQHIWTHCFEAQGYNFQKLLPCDSPITENQAKDILDIFLAEPEIKPQLRSWMSTLKTLEDVLASHEGTLNDLVEQIEKELK